MQEKAELIIKTVVEKFIRSTEAAEEKDVMEDFVDMTIAPKTNLENTTLAEVAETAVIIGDNSDILGIPI